MRSRPAAYAVALAVILMASRAVAGSACATPEEVKAAQLRQFHYQLQVAALNCRGDDPALPSKWNAYIHRHGGALSHNANVMRGYFTRAGGGMAAFDRYNTVLTNRESVRVHEIEGYCERNGSLFEQVLAANSAQLAALASQTVGRPTDFSGCTQSAEAGSADKHKRIARRAE